MKHAIDNARAAVSALEQVQSLYLGRIASVQKAISTAQRAERDAGDAAIEAEKARHAKALDEIASQADRRIAALAALGEAALRLAGEMQDGCDDGAAIIAAAFAPAKLREPDPATPLALEAAE